VDLVHNPWSEGGGRFTSPSWTDNGVVALACRSLPESGGSLVHHLVHYQCSLREGREVDSGGGVLTDCNGRWWRGSNSRAEKRNDDDELSSSGECLREEERKTRAGIEW
jgi:hypothetical protein